MSPAALSEQMNAEGQPAAPSLSPLAIRQRRRRERRRHGAAIVELELDPSVVRLLAKIGLLAEPDRTKAQAVADAFALFVRRALQDAASRSHATG
jgi:hypothetical protein